MGPLFTRETRKAGKTLTLETGKIARQADGCVIATYGETSVMAAVTFAKKQKPGQDFFPLTVHYNEKYYAAGKIPGGFFKREARPTEKETLTSRLIDRPIRPLFVPGFKNEVLVICTVLSHDLVNDPDMVAMIAASAALTISGAPFMGPIAACRVKCAKEPFDFTPPDYSDLFAAVSKAGEKAMRAAYAITDKQERTAAVAAAKETAQEGLSEEQLEDENLGAALKKLESTVLRGDVVKNKKRIDGRQLDEIRDIVSEVGLLPRTHGSALFTRGETQGLVVTTLGTGDDEQMIDSLQGMYKSNFLLHYNFPPYSVRREIGHGKLAWRALQAVLPAPTDFPYTVRLVSEITESNGSSSMASVCAPVAGVAMGLILEEDGSYAVLSDILGDEDHLGDMDFKVAGTENGITSLQMDIKVAGITQDIMKTALAQAKEGRIHIPCEFSVHAPRIETMQIPTDKIREVIGSGGKVIREIVEVSGAKVDINDEGTIKIASPNGEAIKKAYDMIHSIVAEPEEGAVYTGTVVKIVDFGAFVNFFGKRDGLVHVSQIEKPPL
ncbi:Polyribonucleotide nucleotidyltransferase [Nymphon striatum]|nr:Polyribonucleotide nucleotidyltransferase [Nymphon striatum]